MTNRFENPGSFGENQDQKVEHPENGGFREDEIVDFTTPSGEQKGWKIVRFHDHEDMGRLASVSKEGMDTRGIPIARLRRSTTPESLALGQEAGDPPQRRLAGKEVSPPKHRYIKGRGWLK